METRKLDTLAKSPLVRLRHIPQPGSSKAACWWLPLDQDWSSRWSTISERYVHEGTRDRILNLRIRDDDVFVVTYMKAGTTWAQELSWLLLNNLDYEGAARDYPMDRSPFLELSSIENCKDSVKVVEDLRSPRLIKSHLPAQLLPMDIWRRGRKIIYVARNPKDVMVSAYHFMTGINLWKGDMDTFITEFLNDSILYCSFWAHVIDFWQMRHEPNIFFTTYEEMKRDLKGVIEGLCDFLGKSQMNETEMDQLVQHLKFDNMKSGKHSNMTGLFKEREGIGADFEFMRKGIMGTYKNELTYDQIERIDKWTCENLKPYGLKESDIFGEI